MDSLGKCAINFMGLSFVSGAFDEPEDDSAEEAKTPADTLDLSVEGYTVTPNGVVR